MIDSDLFVNMILSILDLIILYYACCGLTNKKRSFTAKNILVGLLGGCIIGVIINYCGSEHSRIIFYIIFTTVIHLLSYIKRIYNTVILFVSIYLIIIPIQITVGLTLFLFSINSENFLYLPAHLFAQALSAVIIMYIYNKAAIYTFLDKIEKELILTLLFFTLNCIAYSMFFYVNIKLNQPYYIIYLLVVFMSFYGMYITASKIYFYTSRLPLIKQDMENALIGIHILRNHSEDLDKINTNIIESTNILGMNTDVLNTEIQKDDNMFYEFIKYKDYMKSKNKKFQYDIKIRYYEPHSKIPDSIMMIILGILIDNAIESSKNDDKIKISLFVNNERLFLRVSNLYNKEINDEFMDVLNQEGFKRKQDNEIRGYGLFKLSEIVYRYDGSFNMRTKHVKEEGLNYIIMTIDIDSAKANIEEQEL